MISSELRLYCTIFIKRLEINSYYENLDEFKLINGTYLKFS